MNFDFESVRARLVNNLRSKTSWADVLPFSTNQRLIDIVAYGVSELARYDEYLLRESKWDLAQNITSLMTQASVLGYKPHRKVGATGTIWVSSKKEAFSEEWVYYKTYSAGDIVRYGETLYEALQETTDQTPSGNPGSWAVTYAMHPYTVGIPKYTVFSTSNGTKYSAVEAANLLPSQDHATVSVVQGIPKSISFVAQGDTYEELEVNSESVENRYYEVFVNGRKWTEIDDIKKAESTEQAYQIIDKVDFSGLYIRFGNDITGAKLTTGDNVAFHYIETLGASGEVLSKGAISGVDSSVVDTQGSSVSLYAYNPNAISGGKDHETIEEIRQNGRQTFQAGQRLVSNVDYAVHLRTFDFIGKVVVWGAYEQNKDSGADLWTWIPSEENNVYISAFTPGRQPLDITLNPDGTQNNDYKIQIIESINSLKPPTDIVQFKPVKFVYGSFHIHAYVESESYLLSEVKQSIIDSVWDQYNIEQMDFKQNIYETEYKGFIANVDGVRHHTSYIAFFDDTNFVNGNDGTGTDYEFSLELVMTPIETGTVEVYVKDTQAAEPSWDLAAIDDGAGGFTAQGTYSAAVSSEVDYDNGLMTVYLSGASLTGDESGSNKRYDVRVRYRTDKPDLVFTGRNQIFYLREVDDVVTEYTS